MYTTARTNGLAVALAGVGALAFGLATGRADPARGSRPNIIIILADDMGYGDASCYGNRVYATPNLDRLAAEGLRFTDFHSAGAVCSATRAGLLTGRYPQRAGIPGVIYAAPNRNRHHGLHPHEITFAERLRRVGYTTAIFGKWHQGYRPQFNPTRNGFDQFRGYVGGNVDYISHIDGAGVYDWWDGTRLVDEPGYTTHLITRHAERFIEANKDRPFCLYVAHEAPHYPSQGPRDEPVRAIGNTRLRPGRTDRKAAHREMMREMDDGVGRILAAVNRHGLTERTFVFFFSDNGATQSGSNGALRGFKGRLWEGGHRVPAIAWWPGRIEAGTVCRQTTICLDVMPTMLALAGASVPVGHRLDGLDLTDLLTANQSLGERDLFWSYLQMSVVRRGAWKLVVRGADPSTVELFNLDDDPGERRNLTDREPQRVAAMRAALGAWRRDVDAGATVQPTRSPLGRG